ncbi:MAG: hypothetical protein CVU11_08175 [Bacteroidetes bacterium HGW-Bacteroidetes-6]|jgi:hypothetical protein|nr:MAG: hypothetical protein CVU11_08175 [Bacteroidetes bacterium HGW-Bacteroidetes-6]
MRKKTNSQFLRFYSKLLRNCLIVLSLPILATGCLFPKHQTHVKPSDSTSVIPDPSDSTVILPIDTSKPAYFDPGTICEYGVPRPNPEYDTIHEQLMYGVIRVE